MVKKMIEIKLRRTNNWLKDNDYTLEDEGKLYDDQLTDIIENTRWYLDNLDFLSTYRVSWQRYTKIKRGHSRITTPLKHRKKEKAL